MCGIFGYVSKTPRTAKETLESLRVLEYRGYDSWGVTVRSNKTFLVEKASGKIGSSIVTLPDSTISLGHTRWATHGGVTKENSHPHLSCDNSLSLVHNGIVENYQLLVKNLSKSHHFRSQTDTEVIIHMIEEEVGSHTLKDAVRKVFSKLEGLNAIAVGSGNGEIVVAKNGSPLVLGEGEDVFYLSSDATAILPHTKRVIFLDDGQLATLGKDGIKIFDLKSGNFIRKKLITLDWSVLDNDLGKYPHYLLKEIYEQPKVIRNVANTLVSEAKILATAVEKAKGTFLIGSGTASYACLAATYLFSKIDRHVNTSFASEFVYLEKFLTKKSLVIALSQSGETIDVVEPLNFAKKSGVRIASIVNALGSTIYRMGDIKILLGAGPELAVASTKAYTAKIAFLLLLTFTLANKVKDAQNLLFQAAGEIERILESSNLKKLKNIAKVLASKEHIYTIGRGVTYALALETAMKIKEVSYIHTEGFAGGELKHGTIALIDKGSPCIVFAPNDETYQAIISNATEIRSRGGLIIGIGPTKADVFDHWIEVKDIQEASLIPLVVPAQILGYYLALEKGYDPDKPRNLAKSVTVK